MSTRTHLTATEKADAGRIIQEKTGYSIKSSNLLNQIFRRSSLAAELGRVSNEILEFIGDQVLSFYVVKIISEKCGSMSLTDDYTFRIRENRFTQIRQSFVCNENLAGIAEEWGICRYLLLGQSDLSNDVANMRKVKADLLESVIGAIAVESNWNTGILEEAVSKTLAMDECLRDIIEETPLAGTIDLENAVSTLKEMAEHGECTMPHYTFAGPDTIGNDAAGKPKWICTCRVVNSKTGLTRTVTASSKKEAKKAAAYLILCEHRGVQNMYGPNDWYAFWRFEGGLLIPDRPDE